MCVFCEWLMDIHFLLNDCFNWYCKEAEQKEEKTTEWRQWTEAPKTRLMLFSPCSPCLLCFVCLSCWIQLTTTRPTNEWLLSWLFKEYIDEFGLYHPLPLLHRLLRRALCFVPASQPSLEFSLWSVHSASDPTPIGPPVEWRKFCHDPDPREHRW